MKVFLGFKNNWSAFVGCINYAFFAISTSSAFLGSVILLLRMVPKALWSKVVLVLKYTSKHTPLPKDHILLALWILTRSKVFRRKREFNMQRITQLEVGTNIRLNM